MRISRRGVSAVEVVSVSSVVVILLATLAPAMQRVRDHARSIHCQNNLKQITLGLHNYHDAHRVFPPGWTNHYDTAGPQTRFGWQAALLPYIDNLPLYQQLDFDAQKLEPSDVFETAIPHLRCPADTTAVLNPIRAGLSTSNYSGNFGPQPPPRWVFGRFGEYWPGRAPTPVRTNGAFWLNSRCGIRDFKDGTSNVILCGERSVTSGAGIWMGVGGNEYEEDQITACQAGNEINSAATAFSSLHGDGAWFAMTDGAIRFFSQDIDSASPGAEKMGTYQLLSHRYDGRRVDLPR